MMEPIPQSPVDEITTNGAVNMKLGATIIVKMLVSYGVGALVKHGVDCGDALQIVLGVLSAIALGGIWLWHNRALLLKRVKIVPSSLSAGSLSPLILIALASVLISSAGCQSKAERAYVARVTFNAALTDARDLRKAKLFPDKQFKAFVDGADTVAPILDQLDTAADTGNSVDFERIFIDLKPKLSALLTKILAAKKAKPSSATQPTKGATSWISQPRFLPLKAA